MRLKILKHAEVGMVEDLVENIRQFISRIRIEQRLHRDAVREQKDDTHQREVDQFNQLQNNISSMLCIRINTNIIQGFS